MQHDDGLDAVLVPMHSICGVSDSSTGYRSGVGTCAIDRFSHCLQHLLVLSLHKLYMPVSCHFMQMLLCFVRIRTRAVTCANL